MRVYGRTYDELGNATWVEVSTASNGDNSAVYLTWLCQVLAGNLGEDPMYSDRGIPAQQAVITEVPPSYWLQRIQNQFAAFFANLTIVRIENTTEPYYSITATCPSGAVLSATIPT